MKKSTRVVRAAEHDLAELGGDRRRQGADRVGEAARGRSPRCPTPSARSSSRRRRGRSRARRRRRCRAAPPAAHDLDAVSQRVAPSASEASRYDFGTAVKRVLGDGEDDRDDGEPERHARR